MQFQQTQRNLLAKFLSRRHVYVTAFFMLKYFHQAMLRPLAMIHKFPTPILRQISIKRNYVKDFYESIYLSNPTP